MVHENIDLIIEAMLFASPDPLTEFTRSPSPLARDLVQCAMDFKDGLLHLHNAPGLGVELTDETLKKYAVS